MIDPKPERGCHGLKSWQKLVGVVAVVVAILIVVSPEFLALGFLGDTAFFDLLVLLIGLQLQGVGVQTRCWFSGVLSTTIQWVITPRLSYLLFISVMTAVGSLVSSMARAVNRIFS